MTDPVVTKVEAVATTVKADVTADEAKVQGFFAKQLAWVKANPVLAVVYSLVTLASLEILHAIAHLF